VVFIESGLLFPFLPGDSLLFTAGLLTQQPDPFAPLWLVLVLAPIAAFLGDQVGYFIGHRFEDYLRNKPDGRFFKQAYLTEVVRAAVGNVLELTHLPPSVAPADRPRSFVTALVRYIRRRRDNYVAVIRSAPSVDPALGLLIDEMHDMLAARLLVTLGHDDSDDLQLASARALVAGIEELALLAEERRLTTESIVEACLRAFTLISDDRVLKVLEQGHG